MEIMNTKLLYIIFALILLASAGWAAEVEVSRISLEKIGDETVCKIYADGPFQYTHEIPEQLPGKPYRVLVDIFPAVHNLNGKEFVNLPPAVVTSIRSSQYAVSPEKIVRIVFDLKETVPYRIEKNGNQIWIYLPDKESAPFPQWASWQQTPTTTSSRTPAGKPVIIGDIGRKSTTTPTTGAPIPAPEKPQITENNPPLMGLPAESNSTSEVPENHPLAQKAETTVDNTEDRAVEEQPDEGQNIVEPSEAGQEQLPAEPPVFAQPQTSAAERKMITYYQAQKSTFLDLDRDQTRKWVTSQADVGQTPETTQGEPVEEISTSKASEPSTPIQNEAVEKDKAPIKTDEKEAEPAKTEDKQLDTPFKKAKPVTAEKTPAGGETTLAGVAPTQPDTAEIVPEMTGVAPTQPDTAEIVPEMAGVAPTQPDTAEIVPEMAGAEEGDKPTSRFRRQPTLPAKLKGTVVAEFPTRMVIEYNSELSRDPFKTLIDETRKNDSQVQKRIPDIETLRLVGVIESANGKNRALLEDIDGFGYILGEGDKVKKGYVSRIDSDKAYFQLYEYGWSRTVALHLGDE